MNFSKNFTFEELIVTEQPYPNYPSGEYEVMNLFYLSNYLLQPIRDKFNALKINSGYRSEKVNSVIGSKPLSQHRSGAAADFVPVDANIETVFDWCVKNLIFGQCILETRNDVQLIHISLVRLNKPNQEAFMSPDKDTYIPYKPILNV